MDLKLGLSLMELYTERMSKKLGTKMTAHAWVAGLGRQNCLTLVN